MNYRGIVGGLYMLSKEDRDTIIKVLDTDGVGCMIALIDDIVTHAYNNGYDKGWNDFYNNVHCVEYDEVDYNI